MDIKKKSSDLDRVKGLSRDLQNILNVSLKTLLLFPS